MKLAVGFSENGVDFDEIDTSNTGDYVDAVCFKKSEEGNWRRAYSIIGEMGNTLSDINPSGKPINGMRATLWTPEEVQWVKYYLHNHYSELTQNAQGPRYYIETLREMCELEAENIAEDNPNDPRVRKLQSIATQAESLDGIVSSLSLTPKPDYKDIYEWVIDTYGADTDEYYYFTSKMTKNENKLIGELKELVDEYDDNIYLILKEKFKEAKKQ